MRQSSGSFRSGFHVLAVIVLVSTVLPVILRPPVKESAAEIFDFARIMPER